MIEKRDVSTLVDMTSAPHQSLIIHRHGECFSSACHFDQINFMTIKFMRGEISRDIASFIVVTCIEETILSR